MNAVLYEAFSSRPRLERLADPTPPDDGVVVKVMATGICRSDWHGWVGHDPMIALPHVPGHELAGVIEEVGKNVRRSGVGDRVTVPFVCACGTCPSCRSGNQQICDDQVQPGFSYWGSFAEYVAIPRADENLVRLPDGMEFATAASLGCRFATSFRAVVDQGRVSAGEWIAVHGCGGVGLSAVMIARALGARVVAIDIADDKLALARAVGAEASVNASRCDDVAAAVLDVTHGGAHVSLDALGHAATCAASIRNLRKRGRHVQVGLLTPGDTNVPMDRVISHELEIIGSHGMPTHRYDAMLGMIESGRLAPEMLIGERINLEHAIERLVTMDRSEVVGVSIVTEFSA